MDFYTHGFTSMMVPDDLDLDQAIEYVSDHIEELPYPKDTSIVRENEGIDTENCHFVTDGDYDQTLRTPFDDATFPKRWS